MIAHYEASNEKDHPLGKLFWQRFNKDPDFVEPKAESWINNLFKP